MELGIDNEWQRRAERIEDHWANHIILSTESAYDRCKTIVPGTNSPYPLKCS